MSNPRFAKTYIDRPRMPSSTVRGPVATRKSLALTKDRSKSVRRDLFLIVDWIMTNIVKQNEIALSGQEGLVWYNYNLL